VKLNLDSIRSDQEWLKQGFELPSYDIEEVRSRTRRSPEWVHFGAGNIFRAFPARIQDELLDQGLAQTGVIIAETSRADKVDYIFKPHDYLSTAVTLKGDGTIALRVVGCLSEGVKLEGPNADWERAREIFINPGLQVVSFTITEKGYSLVDHTGAFTPAVQRDLADPQMRSTHTMGIVCRLLYERFTAGQLPLTLLSMDNVSHNGTLLKKAVLTYAEAWQAAGFLPPEFCQYLQDETKICFPWAMIDKITPAADAAVAAMLEARGYEDTQYPEMNGRKLPPSFANAEETEYLVIEDRFTNGRPAWERGGVIFTDRETVDRAETMKVTTCLNPLHTALAVYGCLLGFERISAEMQDADLVNLIKGIGYVEGLPVVVHPGILDPKEFIDTVIGQRFPNPFLPDTPQRIATDTSQKLSVRFGKTLQAYHSSAPDKLSELIYIPAVLAGWLRYLLAIDDRGEALELSADPLLESLQSQLSAITFGDDRAVDETLEPLLQNSDLFGVNLREVGLADKVIANFKELNRGPGAVRAFLQSLPRT
jgi:fructuronate reductase